MTSAIIFPGQGAQAVGMGKLWYDNFPLAKAVFEEVDDTLGQSLSRLMFEGPEDILSLTENTQPALMTVSIAIMRCLAHEGKLDVAQASYVAGHSLGEYTALAASQALSLADTARLLRIRGQAMQACVAPGQGAMAALLGMDSDTVESLVHEASQEGGICALANDNAEGQIVISGHKDTVQRAMDLAKAMGKRAIPLNVSAPFHCSLMSMAQETMQHALSQVVIQSPLTPIIANVTALPVTDPDSIRAHLVTQVTGRVRWRETMRYMATQGVDRFIEVGSTVLSGMAKRTVPEVKTLTIQSPDDISTLSNV